MTEQQPAIVPDDKDWTWVLERPCPECGFDTAAIDGVDVAVELTRAGSALADRFDMGG